MDIERVLQALRRVIANNGTQVAAARALGVSPAYLSDVLNQRRDPGKKMLSALGIKRVVRYGRE